MKLACAAEIAIGGMPASVAARRSDLSKSSSWRRVRRDVLKCSAVTSVGFSDMEDIVAQARQARLRTAGFGRLDSEQRTRPHRAG